MTRVTRSRQAASSVDETNLKTIAKRTTTGSVQKKIIVKTRSSVKKICSQDENSVPVIKINKLNGSVLGSKLSQSKDDSSIQTSTVLGMKSPVLRDRTNTTNELVKVDAVPKTYDKVQSNKNKNSSTKRITRNSKKQSVSQSSIEKYTVKIPRKQIKDQNKNSLNKNEDLSHKKKETEAVSEKTDFNENIDNSNESVVDNESKSQNVAVSKKGLKRKNLSKQDLEKLLNEDNIDENENQNQKPLVNDKPKPQMVPETRKPIKRKNISIEDVEKLLNEDDNDEILLSDNEETESVQEEEVKKEEQKTKKFFKHKRIEEAAKPVVPTKKNLNHNKKKKVAKKIRNNDSAFSPKMEEQRESTKPQDKKLRTRIAKNYCETSGLSNSIAEAQENVEKPIESDHKGVPIYNVIQLSQTKKDKEPEEMYEFDESFQDDGQKGKKRKKTVKRPTVKRAKKNTNLPFGVAPKIRKKAVKTTEPRPIGNNVQFSGKDINKQSNDKVLNEKQTNEAINVKTTTIISDMASNCVIPNDCPDMGECTFAEAPTIKIISNKKLEGSNRISLTTTPTPKTAASGSKVFSSKQNVTTQLIKQYNKMENHSLIRQSMSPITKLNDEFDIGSPWRAPVDTFNHVRKLVQSTPHVNRQLPHIVKKPVEHVAELNKKSFGSEETVHLSAVSNQVTSKERSLEEMSTIQQDEPRKFGTVISNLSPTKSTSAANSSNNSSTNRSPTQATSLQPLTPLNNQQSPTKATSPPSADPNLPADNKKTIVEDSDISFDNKENISPKQTPKKKIIAPSPFRFERIRSSKRLAGIASYSKSPEKVSPEKRQEPEPEAGPSRLDNPKPTVMKQTTLNSFLNIDDMPESANISTPHGIFDDVCSTPVSGKKPKKFVEEANIENAFGFDDFDCDDVSEIDENAPIVKIATEADVKKSVKGKLFPNARVKSSVPSRISENTVKKTLLKNVLKKKIIEKVPEVLQEREGSDSDNDYEKDNDQVVQHNEPEQDKKKVMLDAISFSDTFDVLSENGEDLAAKVPEEIPLFVDLEPAHFTQPPRKSYNKRKRNLCFDINRYESSDDEEKPEKKKAKKKKPSEPHLSKEDKKRMQEWVKNVNKTFDEIEHFDLVVE